MKKFIILLVIIPLIFFTNCNEDEKKASKPELPEISVVDISQESEWDYWVVGRDDYYFIKSSYSIPEAVLFHSTEANKNYTVLFTETGQLDKVVVDDYIFIFRNFDGNRVDIGIVYPDGEIEILREVNTGYDWDNLTFKSESSTKGWSDVVRWTGRVVAGVPCALSVAATLSTGVAAPLALWTCGNYLLGLSADIAQHEFDVHNGYTDFVNTYSMTSTAFSCSTGNVLSCVSGIGSTALSDFADNLEDLEERSGVVQSTEGALSYGYGDVQITLTWDNEADLDLHVIDPSGEEIFWVHKYSASNGSLDVDDIDGYGPENIYWPQGEAPEGNYQVYVHHYPWTTKPTTSNYTVLIYAFGESKTYSGSISYDEIVFITSFNQYGFKSLMLEKPYNISKSKKY